VKREPGNIRGVAYWAIMSAVVGALCGVAAAPLGVMGLNQQYDLARYDSWSNNLGGMPPGTAIAAIVLSTVSVIFIAVAIALGIYALRSAKKE
jgi:ABC-type antimicrobial peptide transport system permease subunit